MTIVGLHDFVKVSISAEFKSFLCGEGELVGGVHTFVCGVVQVYHAGNRKGESRARRDAHEDDHVDEVKGANILSHGACADDVKTLKTRLCALRSDTLRQCGSGQWCTHRAVPRNHECCHWRPCRGVPRNHRCCHWHSRCALSPSHRFSTFLNFPLRVQILILLSSCSNSSSLFPVPILCTHFAPRKHVI